MKSENGIVRLTGDVANDMSDVLVACRACIREMGRKSLHRKERRLRWTASRKCSLIW